MPGKLFSKFNAGEQCIAVDIPSLELRRQTNRKPSCEKSNFKIN